MGFSLGFWATVGAGGSNAGAYELISTANGTGSSGVITFSSIPGTYKHLQLRNTSKSTASVAGAQDIFLTLNGITTNVYSRHNIICTTSGVTSAGSSTVGSIQLYNCCTTTTTANEYGTIIIDILDYASSAKNKTIRALAGRNSALSLSSGAYQQLTAVTSLTLTAGSGNFQSASRFSLYGIKG